MADINPDILQIYQQLLNISPEQQEEQPPPETNVQQTGFFQNLKSIDKTVRDWIENNFFPKIEVVKKPQPGLFQGWPISFGFGTESATPSPPSAVSPPGAIIRPETPIKRAIPQTPAPGKQIGMPQYTAPGLGQVLGNEPAYPSYEAAPAENYTNAPPSTVSATTPSAGAPAPIPSTEQIAAGITPWKPKTDFTENFKQILDEAIPKEEDLPKAQYKKPTNIIEWLGEFGRLMALQRSGKDPYAVIKAEEQEAEAKTKEARNYIIDRASKTANLKLIALQEQVRREDIERERHAKWLEFLVKSKPELMDNLSFVQAAASNLGVPPSEAAKIIRESYDPTTGELKLSVPPEERLIQQQKALMNWTKQNLIDVGVPPDRAAYIAAGGSKEIFDFLGQQYQNAITNNDTKKAEKIGAQIRTYQEFTQRDLVQEKALNLIKNDPKLTIYDKMFSNKEDAQYMKSQTYLQALQGEKAKMPPQRTPREIKVDEQIKQEARAALGNPAAEKAFTTKHKGITPMDFLYKGGVAGIQLPWPYGMAAKMAPPNTAKDGDKLKMWVDINPEIQKSIRTIMINKYKDIFDAVNQTLINAKKPLLTDTEMQRIATAADRGEDALLWQAVQEILIEHKVPLSK